MEPDDIKRLIEEGLSGSRVAVSGDGRHFEATVITNDFSGKTKLQQHRMVYACLGSRFQSDLLHALSLKTYTEQEWEHMHR